MAASCSNLSIRKFHDCKMPLSEIIGYVGRDEVVYIHMGRIKVKHLEDQIIIGSGFFNYLQVYVIDENRILCVETPLINISSERTLWVLEKTSLKPLMKTTASRWVEDEFFFLEGRNLLIHLHGASVSTCFGYEAFNAADVYDVNTLKKIGQIRIKQKNPIKSFLFHSAKNILVMASDDALEIWQEKANKFHFIETISLPLPRLQCMSMLSLPDGRILTVCIDQHMNGMFLLLDLKNKSWKTKSTLPFVKLHLLPDGETLVGVSRDLIGESNFGCGNLFAMSLPLLEPEKLSDDITRECFINRWGDIACQPFPTYVSNSMITFELFSILNLKQKLIKENIKTVISIIEAVLNLIIEYCNVNEILEKSAGNPMRLFSQLLPNPSLVNAADAKMTPSVKQFGLP